jgi:hypothetical protein
MNTEQRGAEAGEIVAESIEAESIEDIRLVMLRDPVAEASRIPGAPTSIRIEASAIKGSLGLSGSR